MPILLVVYLSMVWLTWSYAGFTTGIEFVVLKRANPQAPISINWISVFFQGLACVAYWMSVLGEFIEKRHKPDINELNEAMWAKSRDGSNPLDS